MKGGSFPERESEREGGLRLRLGGAFGAETGELEGVADIVEAELLGLLFQRGDQALIETDGGAAFPADDMVMVVAGLLGKVEGLARQNDPLDQAGFA